MSLLSLPVHATLSSQIWPIPTPNDAKMTASAPGKITCSTLVLCVMHVHCMYL